MRAPPPDSAWRRVRGLPDEDAQLLRRLERSAATLNLDPGSVTVAAELATLAPGLGPERRQGLTLLALTALWDVAQGSTRTPLQVSHLRDRFRALVGDADAADALLDAGRAALETPEAAAIVGDGARPLVQVGEALYLRRLYDAEGRLAQALAARWRRPIGVDATDALVAVEARPAGVTLSDEQRAAVVEAARRPLTLVSGGPGTGKTSIVVALLRTVARLGVDPRAVALAAPTGKAAWRLGEALRRGVEAVAEPDEADRRLAAALPTPRTLHRLLGFHPGADRFAHHAGNPLTADVVVVDESSMVDVFLMGRLLEAVRPDARLVLLGDADQLPSVAAGAVFRDALELAGPGAARLTHSYRMRADDPAGGGILRLANAVNAGGPLDAAALTERSSPDALTFEGVERLPGRSLRAFLDHWHATTVRPPASVRALTQRAWALRDGRVVEGGQLAPLFAWQARARVLCLTRAGDAGVDRTNARLHALVARDAGQPDSVPMIAGEPVMVVANDADRGLFNGDQGVVLFGAEGRRLAVFPHDDGPRAFHLSSLADRLVLAHATTVHKAQGSEFEQVAVLLPPGDGPLSTRELLYTALTRARRSVVLVGPAGAIDRAAARPTARHGGLAERLGASPT